MDERIRVSRRREVVVGRILRAAEAEFLATGYEAASTSRIAASFEGSTATLFRHFPTKRALLAAVVERIASGWQPGLPPADLSPERWLQAFAAATLDWLLSPGALFVGRLGVCHGAEFPELAETFARVASRPLEAALARQLATWTREGRLRCREPQADAVRFMDLAFAGAVSRALYGELPMPAAARSVHVKGCIALLLAARRPGRSCMLRPA
jgi:AcrR family transcriptional regulator